MPSDAAESSSSPVPSGLAEKAARPSVTGFSQLVRSLASLRFERKSAAEESAFEEFAHETNLRNLRLLFLLLTVLDLVWWATDPFVFGRTDEVRRLYVTYRPALITLSFAIYLLVSRVKLPRGWLELTGTAGGGLILGLTAYGCSQAGGPNQPWVHFLDLAPLSSAVMIVTPRLRVLILAFLGSAMLAGYFGPHPEYWADPLGPLAVSYLVFALLVSLLVGVFTDDVRRANFFLRREIGQHAGALAEQVRQQTAEVRALAAHLERAREEERAQIARELHDALGQELTALRYQLALARQRHQKDPTSIGKNLDELERLLQRTSATTRELVRELRPRVLDDLGLNAALDFLARRTESHTGLVCRMELPAEEEPLPQPAATAAFRIVQESLTNVARHAQAREVRVVVHRQPAELHLSVEDDGIGIAPRTPDAPGFGLLGMRERARALGGELVVEQRPEGGTRVRARLPLDSTPDSAAHLTPHRPADEQAEPTPPDEGP